MHKKIQYSLYGLLQRMIKTFWLVILAALLLPICWYYGDEIQYYALLFIPHIYVRLVHPGPSKTDVL